jgi:Tfp pilus assembly PilM family ATPase
MPRLLALEWDAKEARVVIARMRAGGGLAVEQALAVPLPHRDGAAATEAEIGSALAKALAEHGASRLETLVAVGRSNIELKFLSTPPAPPEELPDLVRFQAMRQFTSLGDDWPLDFVPLAPNADGGSNVLAAAISPELVQQIRQTCDAAGLRLSRLVLRPFAAASLVKSEAVDGKCRMVVDLLGDDADLTVLIGEQVIFPRTVRLPAAVESEVLARALLGEGRRTIISAQNQLGGRRVEEVVIFGDGLHHASVKQLLEKELTLPVRLVDPFVKVEWAEGTRGRKPEFPGTFAPLLGMLLDEASAPAAGAGHAIDFLHVRKRPPPPNRRRAAIAVAAAVAAVLLLAGGAIQWQLRSLDSRIRTLTTQRNDQEKLAKAGARPREEVEKVDRFAAADITWLDELRRLSEQFPPGDQVLVEDFTASYVPSGGGKIIVGGVADNEGRIRQIEERLRDEQHRVLGSGGQYDPEAAGLKWRFKETVTVVPPEEDGPQPAAPAAKTSSKGPLRPSAEGGAK